MNISYSWLSQFIALTELPEETGKRLTGTGLEVEHIDKIEAVPGGLAGVVIGEVLTCQKHPDADKLNITTVDVGAGEPVQIVCGAANVAAGQRVVVATVGAVLHPVSAEGVAKEPFQIKKAKIRGVASEGMICAEDEIGIGTSHDGIMVLTTDVANGTPASRYFDLEPDYRIEIGLTPNRADAASHLGVARDLRAVLNLPIQWPSVDDFRTDAAPTLTVELADAEACPRYTGLEINHLLVQESPDWLKQRLRSIGLTPINNVVDVTNFVCHDLGQPLHAFDADQITSGRIVVQTLPANTPFVTLDGVARKLTATDLMICNDAEPMCIGGVFGGKSSGVTPATTRIFLEAAYFSPASIRRSAQHHGLKTDASFRFERGTDPNMTVYALKRAALLLQTVAANPNGASVSCSDFTDVYPNRIADFRVPVSYRHIDRLIGIKIEPAEIERILTSLDIQLAEKTDAGFVAVVPPYRVDVTREADVIEEILRIYGLDNVLLSAHLGADTLSAFPKVDADQLRQRVGQSLAAAGFNETVTISLTRPAYHDAIRASLPNDDVRLLNPLSEELSVMRQSLVFSALESAVYNLNRRQRDLKLFDFGKVYHRQTTADGTHRYREAYRLSLCLTGNQRAESWQQPAQPVGFHDLAGAAQLVLTTLRVPPFESRPLESPLFQYGLEYVVNKKPVVSLGLVSAKVAKLVDVKQPVFYAEFDWDALLKFHNPAIVYREVPRFPEVRRDLSVVLDVAISFDQVERLARQTERKLLRAVNVFNIYQGENLGAGKKSYSVSFTLQDTEQTLTDAVIDKTMQRLIAAFERDLGAIIRK
jgi:phenylalanyl-tRNA synthetase beta chain